MLHDFFANTAAHCDLTVYLMGKQLKKLTAVNILEL